MTETHSGELSAAQAVQALQEIEGYEEKLTTRTVGLTFMVWAFAVAGIPISYAAAVPWVTEIGGRWPVLLAVLWAPWVLGAIAMTATLWSGYSASVGAHPRPARDWLWGILYTFVFFAIAGVALLVAGIQTDTWIVMGVATGLFTLLIAMVNQIVHSAGRLMIPVYAAGALIVLNALLLAFLNVGGPAAGLATGFVQGFLYSAAGAYLVARG